MGFVYLMLMTLCGLMLWMLISPGSFWRKTAAWQYKNPEANEPSDAAYTTMRVFGGIFLVVFIGLWIHIASSTDDWERAEREKQYQEYQECLDESDEVDEVLNLCENLLPEEP